MSDVIDVLDGDEACRLADRLNADERLKPIVVVTTPAGRRMPYIDASAIAAELGDLAEVYLLATGEYTWAFSRAMPDGTQVYGGAGRVYPIGHDWISDLRRSPLRFAFDEAQGRRTTDTLIADAMAMAAEAGLLDRQTTRAERRHLSGVVKGFPHAERALVEVDRTLVAVIPELVAPGIPLERALARDMTVEGWLDPVGMRLDLRGSVQPADRALTAYAVGDVVLARVAEVGQQSAKLELYPGVTVPIAHDDVTPNELDSLDSLMSPGEVVAARVVASGPRWHLLLADVDDDEPVVRAATLLPGGPPWLDSPAAPEDPVREALAVEPPEEVVASVQMLELGDVLDVVALPAPDVPAPTAAAPTAPPTPAMLDRKRAQGPAQSAPSAPAGTRPAITELSLTVDALRVEVRGLKERVSQLQSQQAMLLTEHHTLTRLHAEQDRELRVAREELERSRTKLRRASKTSTRSEPAPHVFADRERGFRYAVETAWARRTPVGEQRSSPLPSYRIGAEFLDSVDRLKGITVEKISAVVFEVVTGRADHLTGRDMHQLRESGAGGSAYVRRVADAATCWRVALQRGTPSARRLHFWRLPSGEIELSRVVLHDDMTP